MDAIATCNWTEAMEQDVIRLWLDKRSTRQISEYFISRGFHVSRNAVMGKVNRLGLRRAKVTVCPPVPRAPTPYHVNPFAKSTKPQRPPQTFVPKVAQNISPLLVAFADLKLGQCRFECTDAESAADYLFCGLQARDEDCSYCPGHAAICLRPSEARPGSRPFPRAA